MGKGANGGGDGDGGDGDTEGYLDIAKDEVEPVVADVMAGENT